MITRNITLDGSKASVKNLLGIAADNCAWIILQSASGNAQNVYFGEQGHEYHWIIPGGSASLPITNTQNLFVTGTIADVVTISIV